MRFSPALKNLLVILSELFPLQNFIAAYYVQPKLTEESFRQYCLLLR